MSQALCPVCKSTSNVIETRAAFNSLRRRRRCTGPVVHKFSTIEVSDDTPRKIVDLVAWCIRNNITDNFEPLVSEILFNIPCQETEQFKAVA